MNQKQNNLIYFIYFLLTTLLIYFPTIFFDFTYFDDNELILNNLHFLTKPQNLINAFKKDVFFSPSHGFYYRPLLTVSFMLDAFFSKSSPLLYHISNVFYHSLAVCLLFIFLNELKIDRGLAFKLSLIYLVHPILTPAIAWIPGRNDPLMAIFLFPALIWLLKYLKSDQAKYLIYHLIFTSLALLTKETAIMITVVSITFIVLVLKDYSKLPKIIFSWIVIVTVIFMIRQEVLGKLTYLNIIELINSIIKNLPAIAFYITNFLVPIQLSVFPILKDINISLNLAISLIFIITTAILKPKKNRLYLFGLIWFLSFNILNLIKPNISTVPEFLTHRSYTAIVGLIIMIASLNKIKALLSNKYVFTSLITVLAFLSFLFQFNFSDRLTFWSKAVSASPHSSLAHKNYGVMLYFENDYQQALKHYQTALKLNPQEPIVHNNIGVIYMDQGRYELAIDEFEKELKINPNYDKALYNLGIVYYLLKQDQKAEKYWLETLKINPNHAGAYFRLANLYQEKKDYDKAKHYYSLWQNFNPN
ncbi:MAG: hypothetical protein KatS3mg090_0836 [Patescibacteria group bacterium]|nr:MAG: hypothetical protein KatS3mg090_0836 [Patescibacteria group bacterium]